ncbi:restriction endonuclease subunit S [Rhodospira trueperi]|uniref:Type I restriction enzyme, S subunit n=1 Tax=Rhodospira trueperi TaxID=69960 RepID=A0A1G7GLM9_9PROT|nr:restriction endonuclease subunit S [Rhodospira trueperi]SDE89004.1 type I restriction enzyme, S subunit [Rhodospira trueperi]
MNADRLLTLYDRVADAPDAVARLRRLVLDLAVRGKLVEQDPNDEPASELLKRIAAEKARLVKAGALKAERKPKEPSAPLELFDLPIGWAWTNLQSICLSISDGDHQPPPKSENGVPFLVISDVRTKTINYDAARKVPQEYFDGLDPIRKPQSRDLLYTLVGSFGIPVPIRSDEPFCIQRHIGILRPTKQVDVEVLAIFLESEFAFRQAEAAATGIAQKTVPLAGLRAMALPLPPVAEQRRIVAKVDELMTLLDRLEAARSSREATRDRLTAATLARLTAPEMDAEALADHARFALDALPALTTRADQIKPLRQSILNLAVRGKLMPQDPTDEPASELLKRIDAERMRLLMARLVPRQKAPSTDSEREFAPLPIGWNSVALGDVINFVTSGSRGWAEYYSDSGPYFIRAQNIRFGRLLLDDLAHVEPPSNSEGSRTQVARGDLLIVITGAGVTNPAVLEKDIGEAYVSQHVGLVRPTDPAISEWLLLCLLADCGARRELVERAYGAGRPGLNLDNIRSLTIPLPPLAEQHRIVAKVEALMALCDRLEAALTDADTARARLLDALIHEALEPEAEQEVAA